MRVRIGRRRKGDVPRENNLVCTLGKKEPLAKPLVLISAFLCGSLVAHLSRCALSIPQYIQEEAKGETTP